MKGFREKLLADVLEGNSANAKFKQMATETCYAGDN